MNYIPKWVHSKVNTTSYEYPYFYAAKELKNSHIKFNRLSPGKTYIQKSLQTFSYEIDKHTNKIVLLSEIKHRNMFSHEVDMTYIDYDPVTALKKIIYYK